MDLKYGYDINSEANWEPIPESCMNRKGIKSLLELPVLQTALPVGLPSAKNYFVISPVRVSLTEAMSSCQYPFSVYCCSSAND